MKKSERYFSDQSEQFVNVDEVVSGGLAAAGQSTVKTAIAFILRSGATTFFVYPNAKAAKEAWGEFNRLIDPDFEIPEPPSNLITN